MVNVVTQRFIKCHHKLKADGTIRSSRQFALSLDYLPQSLSEVLRERRDVTIELLRKAVERYKINPVYIYTGEGPLFMTEEAFNNLRVLTIVTNAEEDERIVHVPVPAQAGYAGEHIDPNFVQELPTFSLPDYKYNSGTHRSFDVSGDSMEPTLFEGDKVVCSFLEPDLWSSAIKNNYVYVIVTRGDVVVKRVFNDVEEEEALKLVSDNGYYDPYHVPLKDIKEIWYVRAKISPFLPSPTNVQNILHEEVMNLKKIVNQQSQLMEKMNRTLYEVIHQNGQTGPSGKGE